MNRILRYLLILFCLMTFLEPSVAFATDGSLEIKTDISEGQTDKEIYYIEQEEDLSRLFSLDLTKAIVAYQAERVQEEVQEKEVLFLNPSPKTDTVALYQGLLFNPDTQLQSKEDYGITLSQKKPSLSPWVVGLLLLGGVVTVLSLYASMKGRR